ncbi:MAG: STAS domain-containing protein [bacterium]|nr:STAS domain-containing protein [bacterium]
MSDITVSVQKDYAIVYLEGLFTIENLHDIKNNFENILNQDKNLIIDIFQVTFIDSSSLGLFLSYTKKLKKINRHFIIIKATDKIMKILEHTKIIKFITLFDSLSDALEFLKEN